MFELRAGLGLLRISVGSNPGTFPMHDTSPSRPAQVGFATNPLDRLSGLRDDAGAIAAMRADITASTVVIVSDVPVLKRDAQGHAAHFTLIEAQSLGALRGEAFLGSDANGPVFALWLEDSALVPHVSQQADAFLDQRRLAIAGRDDLVLPDLRSVAVQGLVPPGALGMLGQAKSLFYWHSRHRFCGACGGHTVSAAAGWRRDCPHCKAQHFPRTDPVVIMLAHDGDRCLLGRQARFAPGMYSCLAGFLESGETIEDAVRRELAEEAGIATGKVTYLASQPWPFPATLMIGCLAQATSTELRIDTTELEDARWFSREECHAMLESRHPDRLHSPPPMAIAHTILRAWVEGEGLQ